MKQYNPTMQKQKTPLALQALEFVIPHQHLTQKHHK
jgi:hypothetical protein